MRQFITSSAVMFLVAFALDLTPARRQVNFADDPVIIVSKIQTSTYDIVNIPDDPVVVKPTNTGFVITGDLHLVNNPNAGTQDTDVILQILAYRQFTVGPLHPVLTDLTALENFKAVVGNGTREAPDVWFKSQAYVEIGGQAPLHLNGLTKDISTISGNGQKVFDQQDFDRDFILGPTHTYTLAYDLSVFVDHSKLNAFDPPPVITIEFGGLTDYKGMFTQILPVNVPEPSTFALAFLGGGASLLWCHRARKAGGNRNPAITIDC